MTPSAQEYVRSAPLNGSEARYRLALQQILKVG